MAARDDQVTTDAASQADDPLVDEFVRSVVGELREAIGRIVHCTGQLDQQQVWWRPDDSMNSIANLVLHLCGNVDQWIVAGIEGKADARNRPAEFSRRDGLSVAQLSEMLDATLDDVSRTLAGVTRENLLRRRRIQGYDVTGMQAIVESIAHFRGHTQEIIHLTRVQLGDAYRFDFVPGPDQHGGAGSTPPSP